MGHKNAEKPALNLLPLPHQQRGALTQQAEIIPIGVHCAEHLIRVMPAEGLMNRIKLFKWIFLLPGGCS